MNAIAGLVPPWPVCKCWLHLSAAAGGVTAVLPTSKIVLLEVCVSSQPTSNSSRGKMLMVMPPNPMNIPRNPGAFGEFWLIDDFRVHRDLLDLLDPQLDSLLRGRTDFLREAAESTTEEAVQNGLYGLLHYEEEQGEQFKSILFNSFFAASFALFEYKLLTICQRAQTAMGSPFSVDDIRSQSILDRSKSYLTRLGVCFPAQDSDWQVIKKYREIRNKLMHEGGLLSESGELTAYALSKEIASDRNGRELVLTRSFCEEAVNNLKGFVLRVHRAFEDLRQQKV